MLLIQGFLSSPLLPDSSYSLEGILYLSLPVNYLVSCLSLMPQLEYLFLEFANSELQSDSLKSHNSDLADPWTVQLPKLDKIVF
jgi:hypothetical protein